VGPAPASTGCAFTRAYRGYDVEAELDTASPMRPMGKPYPLGLALFRSRAEACLSSKSSMAARSSS